MEVIDYISSDEQPKTLTAKQLKRLKYVVIKSGEIVKWEDLVNYDIPQNIANMMMEWEVIYKSPYSDSFYSSTDISWSHKPNGSYRVSDHWNFTTHTDGKSKKHCITDKPVPSNSHVTISKYVEGQGYQVILTEPSQRHLKGLERNAIKIKYLKDSGTILKRKEFKESVSNGEVYCKIIQKNIEYIGLVIKYTGQELKLVDPIDNQMVFNDNYLNRSKITIELFDKLGNPIDNVFDLPKNLYEGL